MPQLSTTMLRLMGLRRAAPRPGASPGRRASDHEPVRGWIPAAWVGLVVVVLDWSTKAAISFSMSEGQFREVIPDTLAFWYVRNHAMILGLYDNLSLGARKGIAIAAAILGAVTILQILGRGHRLPRFHRLWASVFVGLVFGGMLGNLGERAIHWGVTDFISFRYGPYWLPPGNIADVALFASIPMAIPVIVFELMGRARRRQRAAAPADRRALAGG